MNAANRYRPLGVELRSAVGNSWGAIRIVSGMMDVARNTESSLGTRFAASTQKLSRKRSAGVGKIRQEPGGYEPAPARLAASYILDQGQEVNVAVPAEYIGPKVRVVGLKLLPTSQNVPLKLEASRVTCTVEPSRQ